MRTRLARLTDVLQLTRFATAFAAVGNVWLVILWTRGTPEELASMAADAPIRSTPLVVLLLGGAVAAIGLYAFTLGLNDIVDRRRDRALGEDRPLPTGRIGLDLATIVVAGSVFAAVLGASFFGTAAVRLTVVVAAAALAFNVLGKFVPGAGPLLLGLIFAGHMVIPNIQLQFVWPVVVVMTHALAIEWAAWIIGRRSPAMSRRAVAAITLGWLFWAAVILLIGSYNASGLEDWPAWPSPIAALLIAALAVLFVIYMTHKVRTTGPGPRAAEKLRRYGAIWLSLYAVVWVLSEGMWMATGILAVLGLVGLVVMTIAREAYHLAHQPMGYRR
ncbi:MAG: UbiA family prenyltransferase [Planctomycetota bacterium]